MQVDLKHFDVWDGWLQYLPKDTINPEEKLILKVAFSAVDEVISQNLRGPKKGYNTEKATTTASFIQGLDELRSKSAKLDHWFSFEYYVPTQNGGLEGIKIEIDFYQIPEGSMKDYNKLAVISVDDLSEHQWVLGK